MMIKESYTVRVRPAGRILCSFFCLALLAGLLTGCKPTEKNYKAAYEAAVAKRGVVDLDADVLSGGHKVVATDAPHTREVDGRQVQYRHVRIKSDEGADVDPERRPYAVGVAQWRMPTNARSQAADLSAEGLGAFAAADNHGKWWTLAGAYPTFEEAARAAAAFEAAHTGFSYIGLEGAPVVLCR